MTRDEILSMLAGYEMNKLIAEFVFGMRLEENHGFAGGFYWVGNGIQFGDVRAQNVPDYSTEIEAAWVVVEKIIELFGCDVSAENRADIRAHTRVCICKFQYGKLEYDNPDLLLYVFGETVPLAICRAALLATLKD